MKTTGSQKTRIQAKSPLRGKLSGNKGEAVKSRPSWPKHDPVTPPRRPAAGHDLSEIEILTEQGQRCIPGPFGEKPRLGDFLVRSGAVTEDLIKLGLNHQKNKGLRLGEALVEQNVITEDVMRQALCEQLNVPFIELNHLSVDQSLSRLINRSYAQKHHIVPIAKLGNTVTLVMDDPADTALIDELEAITGFTINVVTSTRAGILDAFARVYENAEESEVGSRLQLIHEEACGTEEAFEHTESYEFRRADSLVTQLIGVGLNNGASDIHIEITDRQVNTRFRIDGILQELHLGSLGEEISRLRREIVSRIKILGSLDIAEKRRPQDGSFRVRLKKSGAEARIDFRISIVPGYYGENVVLRVLDARKAPQSIDDLGFSEKINQTMRRLLKRNTGILLVTGPTGSGKSTTLYGALMTCYRPGIKILSAEDPIEYVYNKITQCEVNRKIGNTFARFIRSFLRHDPEVIMVGEIRDSETAEMAFRAAQTGHLVVSTLHTNDAVSSITRLLDLDVDPGLIASCLLGVLSQRLIREVCSHCKNPYRPSDELLDEFFDAPPRWMSWFKGKGCAQCNYTGYSGRMAVAEVWTPSDNDIILMNKGAGVEQLRKSSCQSTIFMAEDAMEKLLHGKTNLEELIRTLPFSAVSQFRNLGDDAEAVTA